MVHNFYVTAFRPSRKVTINTLKEFWSGGIHVELVSPDIDIGSLRKPNRALVKLTCSMRDKGETISQHIPFAPESITGMALQGFRIFFQPYLTLARVLSSKTLPEIATQMDINASNIDILLSEKTCPSDKAKTVRTLAIFGYKLHRLMFRALAKPHGPSFSDSQLFDELSIETNEIILNPPAKPPRTSFPPGKSAARYKRAL